MSGGGSSAQKAAQQQEADRQAQIAYTTGRINDVYNNPQRQAQIGDYVNATRDFYMGDLNRQNADNNRNLKFAFARSGLTGGSNALDTQQKANEQYTRGVLDVERKAEGAGADLRAQDEDSRTRLIGMAQAGLDATTATQQANNALQNSLQSAQSSMKANAMGDMFGSFADVYQRSRDAAAQRQGYKDYYNLVYQPGFGYGGKQ